MPAITKYKIDFSQYAKDFRALADSRLLEQFKNSSVLKQMIYAFADETQELYDSIIDLMKQRTIYQANNYNLDAIGRIVGQGRENVSIDLGWFFTPDLDGSGADQGRAYVTGGRTGEGMPTDSEYRIMILMRIFSNMNRYSSVPDLQQGIKDILGIDVSFIPVESELGTIDIQVAQKLTPLQRGLLTLTHGLQLAEKSYFIPYPATLKIRNIIEPE